jgi:hypothetical protein
MADERLGPWRPLSLDETVALFASYPSRWWIAGGLALELHIGRSWRPHEDSDVSVLRHDVPELSSLLAQWDVHIAASGELSPWDGKALSSNENQNNLWCRRHADGPWLLDVTISDGDDRCWIYRRDPAVRVAWDQAVLRTATGIPYLAPDLQLLFKSKGIRIKDDLDAREVIPELEDTRRQMLRDSLPDDHPWCLLVR